MEIIKEDHYQNQLQECFFSFVLIKLNKLGLYDIILPFLLIFTIVFAVLEKTKILGVDKIKDQEIAKKNLNSIVAFVVAFLVIASTQLVAVISEVMANVTLLLILGICFMMLVGSFYGDKQFSLEDTKWVKFLMIFMFIGVVIIFLNALDWLQFVFAIFVYWEAEWASGIIFLLVILGFMWYITKENPTKEKKKE